MVDKDLSTFGEKLRQLRKTAGLYQEELADRLSFIHARSNSKIDLRVDGNRISKWERAFKNKVGQEWKPKRQHLLYLIEVFAGQLTLEMARAWALQAGYHLSREELQNIFPLNLDLPATGPAPLATIQQSLKHLEFPPDQRLFGINQDRDHLRSSLEQPDAPWLIAIDGIGGIGKTSLAGVLAQEIRSTGRFYDMAWVSAKQVEFLPGTGLGSNHRPALDVDTLTDALLEQFQPGFLLARSAQEKLALLTDLLKKHACLVVIDNLETVVDSQTLLPVLRQLANPSKFLLTSRHSLYAYADVFCYSLKELSQADAFALLQYEAEMRGVTALVKATPAQLASIYEVAGGNPLALKLVVGQIWVLPLSQVLENLKLAQGKTIDDLYTYIYWQAWQALDETSRAVLLVMPLAQGGTLAQLAAVSELEVNELSQALQRLAVLSLVEVGGDLEQRRYRIHHLTETFLLNEVAKWQLLP